MPVKGYRQFLPADKIIPRFCADLCTFSGFIISGPDNPVQERLPVQPVINWLKSGKQMAAITAMIIVLYWIFESVVDLFFFFPHDSLMDRIFVPDAHELYSRSVGIVLIMGFCVLAQKMLSRYRDALDQVKTLKGLLPICAHCKEILDVQGYWQQLEAYIYEHSDARFSHGICPDCLHELYPELHRANRKVS
jgi:hypothetical protein